MERLLLVFLVCVCFLHVVNAGEASTHGVGHPVKQFSFRPPFSSDESRAIPGWITGGKNTRVTENFIRLTNNVRNTMGYLTNPTAYTDNSIELTAELKIHSPDDPGADGMVLWLMDEPIRKHGTTFGGPEKWKGLAIILDTYDNNGEDPHPYVMVHYNEGEEEFQFAHDGASTFVGGCYADYRNAERIFIHLYIEDDVFSLYVDPRGNGEWIQCMEPARVKMPKQYYFSFSAATGGYSDFHDIISFQVSSMQKRSIEIYKPPPEILKKGDNKEDLPRIADFLAGGIDDCVIHSECLNLDIFETVSDELESLTETIGHELLKVQVAISESADYLRESVFPVSKELSTRRNELQNLRSSLENQMQNLSTFRDSLMASNNNPQNQEEDMSKIIHNIDGAQRVISQLQRQQKTLGQYIDIQLEVLTQESSTSWWLVFAFIFAFIQLIIISLKFCKKEKFRRF